MNPIINTMLMTVDEREFLLVDVIDSLDNIGICTLSSRMAEPGDRNPLMEIFYVGDEPIVGLMKPSATDDYANKLITQIGNIKSCDETIQNRLAVASDNYFVYSQSLIKSLQPVLEMLTPGLYVCHVSKMIQSDGAGNFFWNAYTVRHEVSGSADYNQVIGRENNYIPCFLVPASLMTEYNDARFKQETDKLKKDKKIGGVAFHLSGMFSVLLDGHHNAAACLAENADFSCLVIEPVRQVLYEPRQRAAELGHEPRVIALSTPYVKIPLGGVPESMLENFLMKRYRTKPINYDTLKYKASKPLKSNNRRVLPKEVLLRAELLPDCAMIESAHAVNGLTDEELDALLAGETMLGDKVIISNNYYNSVVTACNYLQYADFDRFIEFALSILKNRDLAATHKYIADRLSGVMDKKIYDFYSEIVDSSEPVYQELHQSVEKFIKRYDEEEAELQREVVKANRIKAAMAKVDSDGGALGFQRIESAMKKTKEKLK